MRPYRVEYVQLDSWEAELVGLWLAENEQWLLLRNIPGDYVVDGYVLVAKSHIVGRKAPAGRKQTEQVLKLKGIGTDLPESFAFGSVVELLRYAERHFKLFQIQDEEETCFCGQLRDADETSFRINSLSPRAELDLNYDLRFPFDELVTIEFGNDYLDSLQLLWHHKARRKWKIDQRSQSN
ncbi:hypothetical protein [Hymenobacter cellulosilyticus]|uniref:Uncharacterized protein n=1 Tax=Hymenobacter cellulosilyticus TaxID=2932248 RepID=A0A8T9Q958_9BACT|nr:hypothetical protein [Hymenobacter cellulosilyticus]UOQ72340.1 hypothetical protein MUN79_27995 [Hymenobacter cellulosilyticus]